MTTRHAVGALKVAQPREGRMAAKGTIAIEVA